MARSTAWRPQDDIAHAVCDAADVFQVPIFGMIDTLHETIYPAPRPRFVAEFYADLDYADDGSLIVTREHEAKDPDRRARGACVRSRKARCRASAAVTSPFAPIGSASIPTPPTPSP